MKKSFIQKGILFIFLTCFTVNVFSQRRLIGIDNLESSVKITGDASANLNDTKSYVANIQGVTIFSGTWSVIGATIVSQNNTSATINWTSIGKKTIQYTANTSTGTVEGFYLVKVLSVSAPSEPSAPTIINQNCSNANLQRGSPPLSSGDTWYWQGTNNNGTSTSNSNTTYTVSSSGTYYLRARNLSGVWSVGSSSVLVTIGSGGNIWYADTDGDGLGDPNTTLTQCTQPSGYVSNNNDQCPFSHGGGTANGCPSSGGLSNENYVYTIAPQKAVTSTSQLTQNKDAIKSVTYYDGLGRPKQSIGIKQSNTEKDIVTHIEYDAFGRQKKDFLPYASTANNGSIKTNALTETNNYYKTHFASDINPTNPNPFSEKGFDNSPLNRVMKQSAPGYDWRLGGGKEIKYDYKTNINNEVKLYKVSLDVNYKPILTGGTTYFTANELYKTINKDENHTGNNKTYTTEEFKNKHGQIILKRTYITNTEKADTYYIYNDLGNLSFVLPPKSDASNEKPDETELSELCYQYIYDHRNRVVQKKIPGKGWEYIIYDDLNRPVLTQDAIQKTKREWLFTKYDVLGRVIYTGIYKHGTELSQSSMQDYFNTSNQQNTSNANTKMHESKLTTSGYSGSYYSNNNFPKTNIELLTINYYDNYTFNRAGSGISVNSYGLTSTNRLKGLATGSKVKVLETNNWITTVTYYDDKARSIYVYSKNEYLLSTDIVKSKLGFLGKVEETTTTHTKTDDNLPTLTIKDFFNYDHVGRLKKHTQQIGTQPLEEIVYNTYDELGQLKNKGVGGKTSQSRLQTVDYIYNVRGWLKGINNTASLGNDLFSFNINYNTVNHSGTKLFNGNISETEWKTKNDNQLRWYRYGYDPLNRIKNAIDNTTDNRYSLLDVDYDKNGNIKTLQRKGHTVMSSGGDVTAYGVMDDLNYTYLSKSNKLIRVSDAIITDANVKGEFKDDYNYSSPDTSNDYTYDANGNMVKDLNKGIGTLTSNGIIYNHLNLPTQVNVKNGYYTNTINYVYDATGVKLSKTVNNNVSIITTEYAGNYIYKGSTSFGLPPGPNNQYSPELQFFNHPEGHIQNDNGTFNYVYQYKDHLGNVRLSYTDSDGSGIIETDGINSEIVEESNYYPFGLKHKGYNNIVTSSNIGQKYKTFQGQEINEEFGLNWHSFKWRNYDASLARFHNIDPLAEDYMDWGGYVFSGNRVIDSWELEGLEPVVINEGTNNLVMVVQGYGGNPPNGATQSQNAAITTPNLRIDYLGLGSLTSLSNNGTQVAVFASSTNNNTKNDIVTSIKNFNSKNPNGNVILVGHSHGGDNIIELASENTNLQINMMIVLDTKDASGGGIFSIDNNNIGGNVKNAINYYQEAEFIGGVKLNFNSSKTNGANILAPGSNHRSIDNDLSKVINKDISNFIKNSSAWKTLTKSYKNSTKQAKERKLPKADPKKTKSNNISS